MMKIIQIIIMTTLLISSISFADGLPLPPPKPSVPPIAPKPPLPPIPPAAPIPTPCIGNLCPIPTRLTCFNLVCSYRRIEPDHGFELCRAAAHFQKVVGIDGCEIPDYSEYPFNPEFEVECDHQVIYNNAAHRFTDELGTRIQAEEGPYPAILLPIGALREEHRYILSSLEFENQHLPGYCYIYPGAP